MDLDAVFQHFLGVVQMEFAVDTGTHVVSRDADRPLDCAGNRSCAPTHTRTLNT